MREYVKFKTDSTNLKNLKHDSWDKYMYVTMAEESPGEGWYPVTHVTPDPPLKPGTEYAFSLTLENDGVVYERYFVVPQGTVFGKRVFSKLKVVESLMKHNLWTSVKSYIEQSGLYDLYLAAQNFREDNEFFEQALATLKMQLGVSDETVEEILNESLADKQ